MQEAPWDSLKHPRDRAGRWRLLNMLTKVPLRTGLPMSKVSTDARHHVPALVSSGHLKQEGDTLFITAKGYREHRRRGKPMGVDLAQHSGQEARELWRYGKELAAGKARKRMRTAAARGDSRGFYRARALAEHYEMQEASMAAEFPAHYFDREFVSPLQGHGWNPKKHPRGRAGRFIDVLKMLKSSPRAGLEGVSLPSGHTVTHRMGQFRVHDREGKIVAKGHSPEDIRMKLVAQKIEPSIQTPRVRAFDPNRVTAKADPGAIPHAEVTGIVNVTNRTPRNRAERMDQIGRNKARKAGYLSGPSINWDEQSRRWRLWGHDGSFGTWEEAEQFYRSRSGSTAAKADPGTIIDIAEKVAVGITMGGLGLWGSRGDPTARNLKLKQKEEAEIAARRAKAAAKAAAKIQAGT